jgi:hypothetical protein
MYFMKLPDEDETPSKDEFIQIPEDDDSGLPFA